MKRCPSCETEKPVAEFYRNRARSDGLGSYCKPCELAISRPGQVSPEGRIKARARARVRRTRLIEQLGGECVCCGEATYEFLQFDHAAGDGAAHRRLLGRTTIFTSDIVRYGLDKFELRCANCNFAKGAYGACPHEVQRIRAAS